MNVTVKTPAEQDKMRAAGRLAASVLDMIEPFVQPGANEGGDVCQACEPKASNSSYSAAPDGTSCGGQDICLGGICKTGCSIDGGFYAAGEVDLF